MLIFCHHHIIYWIWLIKLAQCQFHPILRYKPVLRQYNQILRSKHALIKYQNVLKHYNPILRSKHVLKHYNPIPRSKHELRHYNPILRSKHELRQYNQILRLKHELRPEFTRADSLDRLRLSGVRTVISDSRNFEIPSISEIRYYVKQFFPGNRADTMQSMLWLPSFRDGDSVSPAFQTRVKT